MKWIKASEGPPNEPKQKVFRRKNGNAYEYIQTGLFFDTELYYHGEAIHYSQLEWLDEAEEPPFTFSEVRQYLYKLDAEEITFSKFVELLNTRPNKKP